MYSTLLWRFKKRAVSKSRLAKWTGVDRTRTLPRILTRLSNHRLVVKAGQKYQAVEPPDDRKPWFATWVRGMGNNERETLAYNWAVYDPDRDIIDGLVAAADALSHHAAAKLAKRFRVCAKTITAARRRLATHERPGPKAVRNDAIKKETAQVIATVPVPTVEAPVKPPSPEKKLAESYIKYHGIERDSAQQIVRLCRLLKSLSTKEIGQIISAFVAKFGVGEMLDDALYHFLREKQGRYFSGVTLQQVLADIGSHRQVDDDDDDLSMFGDEEAEFATSD